MIDAQMGPQRKHYDFFKSKTAHKADATPSRTQPITADFSDSSHHDCALIDSDPPLEDSIDMSDISTPQSSDIITV